ncbi:MerR family transcriptional regulator [Actinomadura keratinilytica]
MDDQGEREYRTAELAKAAGITVRTLRFYRERKLLPPPRREGRIAWYDHHHLARLRTITALLERGHTLGGITELMNAFEEGQDVGSLLGVTPTEETPVRLSPRNWPTSSPRGHHGELRRGTQTRLPRHRRRRDRPHQPPPARRLGRPDPRGRPAGRRPGGRSRVRVHAEALASLFLDTMSTHAPAADLDRLRPLAKSVVEAELSLAMDRHIAALREPGAKPGEDA